MIKLRFKDVGYSHLKIRKILKRIDKLDKLGISDWSVNQGHTVFDFSVYNEKREYSLLKATQKIFWYGRNNSNQYLNDSYLLYRTAKFKMLRKSYMDYILDCINSGLAKKHKELHFEGIIKANCINTNYQEELNRFANKEINISELSKIIYGF